MVGRRGQRKSSRAGVKRPEPTMSASDTDSPLVSLPPEIQCIIMSYLAQSRDLNHLCCTCKALSAIVLPTLYHTIELKIPLRWGRLPSLENLLASSSEGLKYTRCLKIVTKQYPPKDNKYLNLEKISDVDDNDVETEHDFEAEGEAQSDSAEIEEAGDEDEGLFRIYHPSASASQSLNAFIRVLISKLPPQQLHMFWWEHACSLSPCTLRTLLKQHGLSIHTLEFRNCSRHWGKADLVNLKMERLTALGVIEIGPLAAELVAKNHETLRHLRLGSELDLAKQYADSGYLDRDENERIMLAETFRDTLQKKFAALNKPSTVVVRLESLSLIGSDLSTFADGLSYPEFDFDCLGTLTLESCCCLEMAFPLLMGPNYGRRKASSALGLHTLAIRHENAGPEFNRAFQKFLLSLKPLTHLHVLLEGHSDHNVNFRKVLQVHGKNLRSLLWDERKGPACDVSEPNAFSLDHEDLAMIAGHCPGLKALGISLDWEAITESGKHHKNIASSFSRLSHIQTLNIRNLPATTTTTNTWLPYDYMVEGLATMLLDIVTKNARTTQLLALKTVAIGAPTYGSVMVGMNHYTPSSASDFFQLRIYHVNYGCHYRDSLSPKLHLIARGTPADALGNAENLNIFTLYWLDSVPLPFESYF